VPLALFKSKDRPNQPTKKSEEILSQVKFTVFNFNSRPRPTDKKRILIISCFSEFGCETVGCLYCIPRLLKRYAGYYLIGMGWHGREYLYRHLLDEFWEIDPENMWLRDYTYAFHHNSRNLTKIEQAAAVHGYVLPSSLLGKFAVGNYCRTCGFTWTEWRNKAEKCQKCQSTYVVNAIFNDPENYQETAVKIPRPGKETMEWARQLVPQNTVAVFARGRKTYGRNLTPEFYVQLIEKLRELNYNVIWLGEKQSTLSCPVEDVLDFSRMDESRDLEKTLAIICCCAFTVQFWTASSRLAGMMGVPFILFESPEQIYCSGMNPGQEGRRLELTTFGPKKVVISHYQSAAAQPERTVQMVEEAIYEMADGNFEDKIGLVEDVEGTNLLKDMYYGK
jgi:hypothetical protein